jgi:hypothetical protein
VLEAAHLDFMRRQHIFFVASAAPCTRVNLSPRSTDSLKVIDERCDAYLDLTGSGNETAAHAKAGGHMTVMMCAFAGPPLILRLYGQGRILPKDSEPYRALLASAFEGREPLGARQIVRLDIDLVQTSCGFGVPVFEYKAERDGLHRWAEKQGAEGLERYRREKNTVSIDGLPTGLLDDDRR